MLELIAQSEAHGLAASEITTLMKMKSPPFEKLLVLGLIVKRIVMPKGAKEKDASKRIISRTNIYHLKRFATLYDPHVDTAIFEMSDADVRLIMKHIASCLSLLYGQNWD